MNPVDLVRLTQFINDNIDTFHLSRVKLIQHLKLREILKRKNPYLFKAKNINAAPDLVLSLLDASLSSSEEGLLGGFLESLAIFVNEMTCNGQKSAAVGIDLEFNRDDIRYLVAVKSGPNGATAANIKHLKKISGMPRKFSSSLGKYHTYRRSWVCATENLRTQIRATI
jgi:hypothetical protein